MDRQFTPTWRHNGYSVSEIKIPPLPEALENEDDMPAYREAVGIFGTMDELQEAVRELEGTAFARQDISVVGAAHEMENAFGSAMIETEMLQDSPDSPRQAPVRTEEEVIGASALIGCAAYAGAVTSLIVSGAMTVGAVLGALVFGALGGALLGAIIVKFVADRHEQVVKEQIRKGGLLLWVRTSDQESEEKACKIMQDHGAHNVHIHEV